jgi:NADH-quinone oxidoreductase subunit N
VGHAHSTLSVLWVYLAGYVLITVGVFTLLAQSEALGDRGVELVDLTGLLKRKPLQVELWAVFLFAMAGIPFTSGFIIKYSVFASAVSNGETLSVVLAALCVVVSAYAYLRPLALMVMREPAPGASEWNSSLASQTTAIVLAVLVLIMGVLPAVWTNALQAILFNP